MRSIFIKESAVRKRIEDMADKGTIRVDRLIYRHLDVMIEHEIEKVISENKGKRHAQKTIKLCPESDM